MPTSYLPYMPEQGLLLPMSLAEWLPENHLAYFVCDAIDALDLQEFHARYEGDGRRRQPFDRRMMVKILIQMYCPTPPEPVENCRVKRDLLIHK